MHGWLINLPGMGRKLEVYTIELQLQDEANLVAATEANAQAELDDYLAQLALQKKQSVIDAATALKQYSAY